MPKPSRRKVLNRKPCVYGRARGKVLAFITKHAPCRIADVANALRGEVNPVTVRYWVLNLVRDGIVVRLPDHMLLLPSQSPPRSPVEHLAMYYPERLDFLVAVARKGRPVMPCQMAAEYAADRPEAAASTYRRWMNEMRKDGLLHRVQGYQSGKCLVPGSYTTDEMRRLGYLVKKARRPLPAHELDDLLS